MWNSGPAFGASIRGAPGAEPPGPAASNPDEGRRGRDRRARLEHGDQAAWEATLRDRERLGWQPLQLPMAVHGIFTEHGEVLCMQCYFGMNDAPGEAPRAGAGGIGLARCDRCGWLVSVTNDVAQMQQLRHELLRSGFPGFELWATESEAGARPDLVLVVRRPGRREREVSIEHEVDWTRGGELLRTDWSVMLRYRDNRREVVPEVTFHARSIPEAAQVVLRFLREHGVEGDQASVSPPRNNPPRGDDLMRDLERRAHHDPAAAAQLQLERERRGQARDRGLMLSHDDPRVRRIVEEYLGNVLDNWNDQPEFNYVRDLSDSEAMELAAHNTVTGWAAYPDVLFTDEFMVDDEDAEVMAGRTVGSLIPVVRHVIQVPRGRVRMNGDEELSATQALMRVAHGLAAEDPDTYLDGGCRDMALILKRFSDFKGFGDRVRVVYGTMRIPGNVVEHAWLEVDGNRLDPIAEIRKWGGRVGPYEEDASVGNYLGTVYEDIDLDDHAKEIAAGWGRLKIKEIVSENRRNGMLPARVRMNGDEELRRLQRAALEQPGDAHARGAYAAAWRRAGSPDQWPDRDPRKHPVEGDVVDNETAAGWRGKNTEFRRYRVSATGFREERTIVGVQKKPFVLFEWLGTIGRNDFWREKGLLKDTTHPYFSRLGRVDDAGVAPLSCLLPQAPGRHREVLPASWSAWARGGHVVERAPSPFPKPVVPRRARKLPPSGNPPRGDDELRRLERALALDPHDAAAIMALRAARARRGDLRAQLEQEAWDRADEGSRGDRNGGSIVLLGPHGTTIYALHEIPTAVLWIRAGRRDPRAQPQPGDVLTLDGGEVTLEVIGRNPTGSSVHFWIRTPDGSQTTTLPIWRWRESYSPPRVSAFDVVRIEGMPT